MTAIGIVPTSTTAARLFKNAVFQEAWVRWKKIKIFGPCSSSGSTKSLDQKVAQEV